MGQIDGGIWLLVFAALLAILFFQRSFQRRLRDALIEISDHFRGGPPSPMHPSPSNDGALLRRRSRQARD